MKHSIPRQVLFVLIFVASLALAPTAMAQIGPYYYGGWGNYDTSATYNTALNTASQQKMLGQTQAAAQSAAMQSGIRSTLSNQAAARNQAAAARQQDYRDWSFQVQQQQTAQRQARQMYQPRPAMATATAASFEPSISMSAAVAGPAPASDIIKWRPILYDRRFDVLRAEVEAPYLRTGGKTLSQPTAADYRNMIKAFQQMKAILKQMDAEITAREYLDTTQDIDGLIKQATDRAERLEAAAKPKS